MNCAHFGADVRVATMDGSMGIKGLVTDLFPALAEPSYFYACGPAKMLAAVGKRPALRWRNELRGAHGLRLRRLRGLHLPDKERRQARLQGRPGVQEGGGACVNTQVTLSGWTLDNPVIPASGTFGYGYEFAEWYDINILGTFSFKGTTQEARFGNPTPRIADAPAGMLNAVGLQNPGVRAVIREELPKLKKVFHKKGHRQRQRLFRGGIRPHLRAPRPRGTGRASGSEHLLPQRPRRRHGLRRLAGDGRQSHRGGQGGDEKARLHEALAQRRRHRRSGARPAKRRARTAFCLINTLLGMRIDPAHAPADPRQHLWRPSLRPLRAARGAAHGLAGLRGREHPHHRHGRRRKRRGRAGNDARRRHGGGKWARRT